MSSSLAVAEARSSVVPAAPAWAFHAALNAVACVGAYKGLQKFELASQNQWDHTLFMEALPFSMLAAIPVAYLVYFLNRRLHD